MEGVHLSHYLKNNELTGKEEVIEREIIATGEQYTSFQYKDDIAFLRKQEYHLIKNLNINFESIKKLEYGPGSNGYKDGYKVKIYV